MNNLVYAEGRRPVRNEFARAIDKMAKEALDKSTERFINTMLFSSKDMPKLGPVTFHKSDVIGDVIRSAHQDGVSADLAFDHAKDMGHQKWGSKFRQSREHHFPIIMDDIVRPNAIATLRWRIHRSMRLWEYEDDRGLIYRAQDKYMEQLVNRGGRLPSLYDKRHFLEFAGPVDRLRRFTIARDDRGVTYQFNPHQGPPEVRAPIPHKGVLSGPLWDTKDPNNKEAIMAATKKTNTVDTETPIAQQQPKLALFFRINDLPQELTQKQTIEHVTKLLTLGANSINVQRFIRDDVSSNYAASRY